MWPFTPGWKSKNRERAIKSIQKIRDEKVLLEAVKTAGHPAVRMVALDLLDVDRHQQLFLELASRDDWSRTGTYWTDVKLKALSLIKDMNVVVGVLRKQGEGVMFRRDAAKLISDQRVLVEWARFEEDSSHVISAILDRITDKALRVDLVKDPGGECVRREGVVRCIALKFFYLLYVREDIELLRDIALTSRYLLTKYLAITKLPEKIQATSEMQQVLANFVLKSSIGSDKEFTDAINLLVDKGILQSIIDADSRVYHHPYPGKRTLENKRSFAAMNRMDKLGYEVTVNGKVF